MELFHRRQHGFDPVTNALVMMQVQMGKMPDLTHSKLLPVDAVMLDFESSIHKVMVQLKA